MRRTTVVVVVAAAVIVSVSACLSLEIPSD